MKLIHEQISTSFDMKLESVDPIIPQSKYHLSLTRTLYVKDYQRELFQSKIAEALKKTLINFPLPESILNLQVQSKREFLLKHIP